MSRFAKVACIAFFSVSSVVLAFTLAWLLLASNNFLYSVWHDVGGIGMGIDKFGPKNRYKPGFADTSFDQRVQLFAEINESVHNHGHGLEDITYESSSSKGPQIMLREPEVVHLQDVANLIDTLKVFVVINLLLWVALGLFILKHSNRLIYWRSQLAGVGGSLLLGLILIMLIGPVKVFNQLHIWIFPKDHQWFFYYQESLMSTLMLAPYLFGWIAGGLVLLAVVFFTLIVSCSVAVEKKIKPQVS